MSGTGYYGIAEFDGRLWDVRRLLVSGDRERARVEGALLAEVAQATGVDWVEEELRALWSAADRVGHARSA